MRFENRNRGCRDGKNVNYIILIAKLANSKYREKKYGKCKDLEMMLNANLEIKSHD